MYQKIKTSTLKSILLIAFIISTSFLFAKSIAPSENQTLYQHMVEVNKEWTKATIDLPILQKEIAFENDVQRIQTHLRLVENILRESDVNHFSNKQITKRNHHLDVLRTYWQKGVFPKNIFHKKRQPYFIDHLNTACAVGHLIREDGGKALTEKIKKENNYAYISELKTIYPEIKTWATENGFTLAELAWIQPGYPPAAQSWHQVGNDGGTDGQINVMKTIGDKLYMAGDFTSVDGVAANSIIAWDGNDWYTLGEGVDGEIFALEATPQGHLIIGGNFTLNSDPEYSNIAIKTANGWIGLQKGEMNGTVYSLKLQNELYAAGDFTHIDGQPISYFAKRNISNSDTWNSSVTKMVSGVSTEIGLAMEVNGPVYAMEVIDDKLLLGGEFTQTAPHIIDGSVNQLNTRYLAYWSVDNKDWETEFDGEYLPVHAIGQFDGRLAIGGATGQHSLSIQNDTGWEYWYMTQLDEEDGDGKIHGFLSFNDGYYVYGDISNQPLVGTYSEGFVSISSNYINGLSGGALFDKSVRAMAVFQGNAYLVGDFTTVQGGGWGGNPDSEFNGMTYSSLDGLTATEELITKEIHIYHASQNLYVSYEDLEKDAALNIYNLQGQILKTINLQKGSANEIINLPNWSAGTYVYQIVNEQGQQSGKFGAF